MSHKATKRLLEAAIEAQKAAPKALLPKAGIVKQIVNEKELEKWKQIPISKVAEMLISEPVRIAPVEEKFRGYKVKQSNPVPIASGAPSRMF